MMSECAGWAGETDDDAQILEKNNKSHVEKKKKPSLATRKKDSERKKKKKKKGERERASSRVRLDCAHIPLQLQHILTYLCPHIRLLLSLTRQHYPPL